ncbi:MAG: hypothetical protein DCC65_07940 [Planctomycetota bacterium]|nr:MAG: hypothetical protein DCC65_07940 [Planctomycetota bacterium]
MAKPLRTPPPSSSVARLFDLDAAARAVAAPVVERESQVPEHPTVAEPIPAARTVLPPAHPAAIPSIKREFVFTPASEATLLQLVETYRRSTGTKLTASHVARALMKGVAHCMEHLEREARRIGPLKLPSNARGRELERERFEARIADAFIAGIRSAPAMDRD